MAKYSSSELQKNLMQIVIDKEIGSGKFKVYHAKSYDDNQFYAVKVFPINPQTHPIYQHEKKIHSRLNHKNIVRYKPSSNITSKNFNYDVILTEYAPYGNFFDIVSNRGLTNEKILRTYFHQLIEGLEYLQSQNVAHLDIKLDNLLLGSDFQMKIADFDQSDDLSSPNLRAKGTAFYRAPEIIEGKCKNFTAADIYSAGIVLFALKAGGFPFYESNDEHGHYLIHYDLFTANNKAFWEEKVADKKNKAFFSEEFIELINGMLERDPKRRFTFFDIKKSRWYNGSTFNSESLKQQMERTWERILFVKTSKKE